MIKKSFIFLDKIGAATEKKIWKSGVHTWENFIATPRVQGITKARKIFYDQKLKVAKEAVWDDNAHFFAKLFPSSEHWRLFDFFKEQVCFLDIETSGYYGDITVIGLYDGKDTKIMVKGKNLDPHILRQELQKYKLLVTFNGSSFDLPVINRYYPNTIPKIPHLDLRHPLAKLGYTGGLKHIERVLGVNRAAEVADVSGADAVYLWNRYRTTGEEKFLQKLIQYNEEDIINLKPLAEFVYTEMAKKTFDSIIAPINEENKEKTKLIL